MRVQAIPLNLNDLERITGGNMMAPPEFPYSPGMEVMGVVDACGEGAEHWLGRRVVATTKRAHGGFAEQAICPTGASVRHARRHRTARRRGALLPVPPRVAGPVRPRRPRRRARPCWSMLRPAERALPPSSSPTNCGARVFATAGTDDKVAALPRPRRRRRHQLQHRGLRRDRAGRDRATAASTSCSTTSAKRSWRVIDQVHRLQRSLRHERLRIEQGRRRRTLHRPASRAPCRTSSSAVCS